MSSIHVELRVGEEIDIDGPATLQLEEKSGQRARLHILANEDIAISKPRPVSQSSAARMGVRVQTEITKGRRA